MSDIDLLAWGRDLGARLASAKEFVEDQENQAEAEKFGAELAQLEETLSLQTKEELESIAERLRKDEIEPEMAEQLIASALARPITESMTVISKAIVSNPTNPYLQSVARAHVEMQLQKREMLFQQFAGPARGEMAVAARQLEERRVAAQEANAESGLLSARAQAASVVEPFVTTAVSEGLLSQQDAAKILETFGLPPEMAVNQPPSLLTEEGQQQYRALTQSIDILRQQLAENPDDPELQAALNDAIQARGNLERRAALEVVTSKTTQNLLSEVKEGKTPFRDALKWWVMFALAPEWTVLQDPKEFRRRREEVRHKAANVWDALKQTSVGDIIQRVEGLVGGWFGGDDSESDTEQSPAPPSRPGGPPDVEAFRNLYGEPPPAVRTREEGGSGATAPPGRERQRRDAADDIRYSPPMSVVPEEVVTRRSKPASERLTDVSEITPPPEKEARRPAKSRPKPDRERRPRERVRKGPDLTDIQQRAVIARKRLQEALRGEE